MLNVLIGLLTFFFVLERITKEVVCETKEIKIRGMERRSKIKRWNKIKIQASSVVPR